MFGRPGGGVKASRIERIAPAAGPQGRQRKWEGAARAAAGGPAGWGRERGARDNVRPEGGGLLVSALGTAGEEPPDGFPLVGGFQPAAGLDAAGSRNLAKKPDTARGGRRVARPHQNKKPKTTIFDHFD